MFKSIGNSKVFLTAFATCAAVFSTSCAQTKLFEAERTTASPHVPASGVRVETANGSISVKQADRTDVQIQSRIKALTPERLEATRIVAERSSDKTLFVHAVWPEGKRRNREGCSFEILVPEAHAAHLRSANGSLSVRGLRGPAELRTSNGKIEVEDHDGSVVADTTNGSIFTKAVKGRINGQTSNGKVTVVDAGESVTVRTSNGSIRIALAHASTGPITARTSNGSIVLELGEAFAGELTLETSHGSLDVDEVPGAHLKQMSKKKARLEIGKSSQKSSATTSNGSIRVRAR